MKRPIADLIWALSPLAALITRVGGWCSPTLKHFGVPVAVTFFAWLKFGTKTSAYKWIYLVLFLAVLGAWSLPMTLIGSAVSGSFFNWVWLWVLAALQALALIPLFMLHSDWDAPSLKWLFGGYLYVFIFGALSSSSNAFGWPTHAWFEIISGLTYGALAAWIIGEKEIV